MLEATLGFRPAPKSSIPVTLAVGHTSSLVSAGLADILRRTPGCDVTLSRISPTQSDTCPPAAQVVFGDSAMLERRREESKSALGDCALTRAKFVLVTTGGEAGAQDHKAAGEIDDHVSIESAEQEFFALVQRLLGVDSVPQKPRPEARSAPRPRGGLAPGVLRRVRTYIEEHLADKVHTSDLARVAALSPGHFNRAFRESLGCSPHRFLMQERVAVATRLLQRTTRALADIALDAGFADQSHFSRTYAAVTGETPSACRRRYR